MYRGFFSFQVFYWFSFLLFFCDASSERSNTTCNVYGAKKITWRINLEPEKRSITGRIEIPLCLMRIRQSDPQTIWLMRICITPQRGEGGGLWKSWSCPECAFSTTSQISHLSSSTSSTSAALPFRYLSHNLFLLTHTQSFKIKNPARLFFITISRNTGGGKVLHALKTKAKKTKSCRLHARFSQSASLIASIRPSTANVFFIFLSLSLSFHQESWTQRFCSAATANAERTHEPTPEPPAQVMLSVRQTILRTSKSVGRRF